MSEQPRDPEEARLSGIMRFAMPESPDPVGRADAVVRRARTVHRRRGAGGVLAVGVVALAVVMGPNLLDTGATPSHQAGTGPHSSMPPAVAALDDPYTCPAGGERDRSASAPITDSIPAGAVLARLCSRHGKELSPWAPPLDALVTRVELVSQSYNDLPKGEPLPCPGSPNPRPSFSVTFQYPDGHLVRVNAESIGTGVCNFISIDGRDDLGRSHSGTVMSTYLRELRHQRANHQPASSIAASAADRLRCTSAISASQSLATSESELGLVRAIGCQFDFMFPKRHATGAFSPAQVQAINRDYAAHHTRTSPPGATCLNPDPPDIVIVGVNAWGDVVRLHSSCYVYTRLVGPDQRQVFWAETLTTMRMIDAVLH